MFQEWLKDYEKLREENNMSKEEIIKNIENILLHAETNLLDKDNTNEDVEKLEEENYKLKSQLNDLYSLNKKILKEIISKHYMFAVPVTKTYVEMFTSTDLPNYETKIVNIPLDEAVIEMFKRELFNIFEED